MAVWHSRLLIQIVYGPSACPAGPSQMTTSVLTALYSVAQRTSLLFPTSSKSTGTPRSFFKVQWRDRNRIGQTQSANQQPISHRVLGIAIQKKPVRIANLLENSFFLWTLGILNGTAISSGRFLFYFCLITQCFGFIPSSCSFFSSTCSVWAQIMFRVRANMFRVQTERVSNRFCTRSALKLVLFPLFFVLERIAFLSSCFVALQFSLLFILFSNFCFSKKSHCALLFIQHNQQLDVYYSHTTSLL